MISAELQRHLKAQGPHDRKCMLDALGIRSMDLELWLKDPKDQKLSGETLEQLSAWALGHFGLTADGAWVRTHMRPVSTSLAVRPPAASHGPEYEVGQASVSGGIICPAKLGKDLPEFDELRFNAAKRREAEEEAERKREKHGFKNAVDVLPLMTFGRVRA